MNFKTALIAVGLVLTSSFIAPTYAATPQSSASTTSVKHLVVNVSHNSQSTVNPEESGLEQEYELDTWQANNSTILLWYPPERGFTAKSSTIAQQIAQQAGMDVWLMDVHRAQFLPHTPEAMLAYPPAEIEVMIDWLLRERSQRIVIVGEQRSAQSVLKAVANWKAEHPDDRRVQGVLLISPNLYWQREAGGQRVFAPISDKVDIPIFVLQPELASQRWYAGDIQQRLGRQGNPVMLRLVKGVRDGYWHNDFDPTEFEIAASRQMAREFMTVRRFFNRHMAYPGHADIKSLPESKSENLGNIAKPTPHRAYAGLKAYPRPLKAPSLELQRLPTQGAEAVFNLADWKGSVVLVNFWATWCPPCVEEMPSMSRLQGRYKEQGLRVIAVDVDEPRATIDAFLRRLPVDLPIALDPGGEAMRRWKVFSFPTSFLVDRQGRLRYGLSGAVDWTDAEVEAVIISLLNETPLASALPPSTVEPKSQR